MLLPHCSLFHSSLFPAHWYCLLLTAHSPSSSFFLTDLCSIVHCSLLTLPHSSQLIAPYSLLLPHCSLFHSSLFPAHSTTQLAAHFSFLTAHCSIVHCSLLTGTAYCSLLIAPSLQLLHHYSLLHSSLFTVPCPLLPAHCSMFAVHYSLQLLTIPCSLFTTYCSLHIINCALGSLLIIHSLQLLTAEFIYCRCSQLTIHSLPLLTAHYSFTAPAHSSQLPTFCSLLLTSSPAYCMPLKCLLLIDHC